MAALEDHLRAISGVALGILGLPTAAAQGFRLSGDANSSSRERQARFEGVYNNNEWRPGNQMKEGVPKSGLGSTLSFTYNARRAITSLVRRSGVRSILDAPCGDLTWMRDLFKEFDSLNVSYTGVDIVRGEIKRLQDEFRDDPRRRFAVADVTRSPLPRADLIFSREALQHMPAVDAVRTLHNYARSGAKYLLTTTYALSGDRKSQMASGSKPLGEETPHLLNMMSTRGPHMNFLDLASFPYSVFEPPCVIIRSRSTVTFGSSHASCLVPTPTLLLTQAGAWIETLAFCAGSSSSSSRVKRVPSLYVLWHSNLGGSNLGGLLVL